MADRMKVLHTQRIEGRDKGFSTEIGSAWPVRGRDGWYSIKLRYVPAQVNDKGEIELLLLPADRDDKPRQSRDAPGYREQAPLDDPAATDEIPW